LNLNARKMWSVDFLLKRRTRLRPSRLVSRNRPGWRWSRIRRFAANRRRSAKCWSHQLPGRLLVGLRSVIERACIHGGATKTFMLHPTWFGDFNLASTICIRTFVAFTNLSIHCLPPGTRMVRRLILEGGMTWFHQVFAGVVL